MPESTRNRLFACLLIAFALVLTGVARASSSQPAKARRRTTARVGATCQGASALLRGKLDVVVQGAMQGRPDLVRSSVEAVSIFWRDNRGRFARQMPDAAFQDADAEMAQMVHSEDKDPLAAARSAVMLADASLAWCAELSTSGNQLYLLRLVGETAWLRAQAIDISWPEGIDAAQQAVASLLAQAGRNDLANKLADSMAEVLSTPVEERGDTKAAEGLLDLEGLVAAVVSPVGQNE